MTDSLWSYDEMDLKKETSVGGNYVKESGVYNCLITKAEIIKSNSSNAKAIKLTFETESKENFIVTHWFLKSDGTENEYARAELNKLVFLLKLKNSSLKTRIKDGETTIPILEGKSIGVIDKVEEVGEYTNHIVKAYFDIKTKKTADEITNKKECVAVDKWKEIFEKDPKPQKKIVPKQEEIEEDDEFPF